LASFLERAGGGTKEKIFFFFPCFACPREDEDMGAVPNGTVSSLSLVILFF
jgi:hypothetical protein